MTHSIAHNNFDLIRLIAALQVAVLHVLYYLAPQWGGAPIFQYLSWFPGVPIFFFISGFLISRSYEKTADTLDYARNRALRIFPALHVCVLLNLVMIWATGYFDKVHASFFDIFLLYAGKTTILQFYNPDFMRQFGDGVLNGSLWTICVELQFYVLTPFLYKLLLQGRRLNPNISLIACIVLSIICNRLLYSLQSEFHESNLWKLARVSFLPWIYMFLTGVLVQRNFQVISKLIRPNLLIPCLLAYSAYAWLLYRNEFAFNNSISPLLFFPLAAVTLIAAYSRPDFARNLLKGHDFSYGIYVYHIPFMNMFLYYGLQGKISYVASVITITVATAITSWFLIERPSLRHKNRAAHPVNLTSASS